MGPVETLNVVEYPKIETLFDRGPDFTVQTYKVRWAEFRLVDPVEWIVTEKIDGTNVRIFYRGDRSQPLFFGRTENAQMPTFLVQYLQLLFTVDLFEAAFPWLDQARQEQASVPGSVVLFGEGYGAKIQGGGKYSETPKFRLFDVTVGDKWLDWNNVVDVAGKLGVETVPVVQTGDDLGDVVERVRNGVMSEVASKEANNAHVVAEGVVARTDPTLYTWRGHRVMWKLKTKDFTGGR
jgi:hypothetical protein